MPPKKKRSTVVDTMKYMAILHNATRSKPNTQQEEDSDEPTPWFCYIPPLGVSLQLVRDNGEPITGYLDIKWANVVVQRLCNDLLSDSEWLANVKDKPTCAPLGGMWDGFGSIIPIAIHLPANL